MIELEEQYYDVKDSLPYVIKDLEKEKECVKTLKPAMINERNILNVEDIVKPVEEVKQIMIRVQLKPFSRKQVPN